MDLHQAQDQKTDAYAAADQVAAAGIASMIAAESSLFSAATTAYGNDASALANHTYNPAFTPGEMAPHDPITKDTAGLDPFAPGSGQADAFYGYYNNYYGYTGLIGYGSGYWYGRLGWESFYTQSITPQINLGWYGSGYASGYGYSGYGGTTPTANTGLGTRETQIGANANLDINSLPSLPLTPPDPGFGQGLYNGAAVVQTVPIETMLQYRDQVFAQTGENSYWSDPLHHEPSWLRPGPVDVSETIKSQAATQAPITFAPVKEAAAKEAGEGTKPAADPDWLSAEDGALIGDAIQLGLDIVGIVEPTPFCDLRSAAISVYRQEWWQAGISLVAVIPYFGDVAKFGKIPKAIVFVEKLIVKAASSAAVVERVTPYLKTVYKSLDNLLNNQTIISKLPEDAVNGLKKLKGKLDEFFEAASKGAPGAVKLTASMADDLAKVATKNPSSTKLVLGRTFESGVGYVNVAEHYKATYFKLSNWRELTRRFTSSEIWEINKAFLAQQIRAIAPR